VFLLVALSVTLVACSATTSVPRGPVPEGHWVRYKHVPQVVDLAGPRSNGSFTVAADGRLFNLTSAGVLTPFARGASGYATPLGPEPYITAPGSDRVAGSSCSFNSGATFALAPAAPAGVIEISQAGVARRFASVPGAARPDGITYDSTGHFGHRILVTARNHGQTTVLAIDCTGGVHTVTTNAPSVEGGIAVAPASFGRYAGDLIAPDESSGRVFAIAPSGTVTVLAQSGLPHGGDIGVESAGFVPAGFRASDSAYLADRFSKGNKHPGTDSILRLPGAELLSAGVHAGDLLVASEGSARTIAVHCGSSCSVKYVAIGLAVSHAEGHIVFGALGKGA
jgi:hypothetical protein